MIFTIRSALFFVMTLFLLSNPSQSQESSAVITEKSASTSQSTQRAAEVARKTSTEVAASAVAASHQWEPPHLIVLNGVPIVVLGGIFCAIFCIRRALPNTWSLADALSEELPLTPSKKITTTKGTGGVGDVIVEEPILDKDGNPVLIPEMRASSSRLIALMGMVSMLFIYIGFAAFALFFFGATGELPKSLDNAVSFLVAGMTLFAPYAVNKFASLFKGINGGK